MSSIYFRNRKYQKNVDAFFFLKDGERTAHPTWVVGDSVTVLFDATEEQESAVLEVGFDDVSIFDKKAHIPCTVVKRNHSIVWRNVGEFQVLCDSVTLEANSGIWEDLLVWIVIGTRPGWASEPEEDDDEQGNP
jgi:hypothetical protein